MIARLFKKALSPSAPQPWRIPAGERVYAIGDVHGYLELLDQLLARIADDDATRPPARTTLVFLGDLVDRGPESRGVVERAMALKAAIKDGKSPFAAVRFLKGNHEEVFQRCAEGDERATRHFIRMGGRETILSYPIDVDDYDALSVAELAERMTTLVPRDHLAFVTSFENCVTIGDYAFVHAGIRPGVPVSEQRKEDMRWIRDGFINDTRMHDMMVVHGHTIAEDVELLPNRIGVDTGAYRTGRLSAVGLEGEARWVVQVEGAAHPELARPEWAG